MYASGIAVAEEVRPDTAAVALPGLVVSGQASELPGPDKVRITAPAVQLQDPGSIADLGGLLPSVRLAYNSRGDKHLMVRGAPERHVQTFMDGIPLNLPWDERVDLETIPVTGTGRIEGTRGLTTLLDGPGVLAGSVKILPPSVDPGAFKTRIGLAAGTMVSGRTDIQHLNRAGSWDLLGAMGWQGRNAFPLPGSMQPGVDGDRRQNSDLSQYSLMVRGSRPVRKTGSWSVLATGWKATKGVPPELNEGDDARFWRYPKRLRGLIGTTLTMPLDEDERWDLSATLSADHFEQEIDPRGPDDWDTPLEPGQDYETDNDWTGYGNLRLDSWVAESSRVSLLATGRYTNHQESLTVGGPTETYSQWLGSIIAEAELKAARDLTVRAGLGVDMTSTPEAGDKKANDPITDGAYNLRLTWDLAHRSELYGSASRRSRFPSLRESYSGALGKFVANPELLPEKQNLFEVGYLTAWSGWRLQTAAFLQYLEDGIEKVALPGPDNQFQRQNQTEIRVPGLEIIGGWHPAPDWDITAQYTLLDARVQEDGSYDRSAEDRADYLARLGAYWQPERGPGALGEAVVTGPRWSADTTDPVDGLTRLPAGVTWNARLNWRFVRPSWILALHFRVSNIFDQRVDDQVGLPQPGRVISGGATVQF